MQPIKENEWFWVNEVPDVEAVKKGNTIYLRGNLRSAIFYYFFIRKSVDELGFKVKIKNAEVKCHWIWRSNGMEGYRLNLGNAATMYIAIVNIDTGSILFLDVGMDFYFQVAVELQAERRTDDVFQVFYLGGKYTERRLIDGSAPMSNYINLKVSTEKYLSNLKKRGALMRGMYIGVSFEEEATFYTDHTGLIFYLK